MRENTSNDLNQILKTLHLPTVRREFSDQARIAEKESLTYEGYLLVLMEQEKDVRWNNRVDRLLRASKLPLEKNLDSLDRTRYPDMINRHIDILTDGSFLDRCENVLAFGRPGSGKSHILCGIGQELIYLGKQVLFTTCSMLVQDLLIAKRDLELKQLLKKLQRNDVLIIDDIGYVQQSREEMEVLFTLLADFYERRSLMITSNLKFSEWEIIFKDPMTTAAAIDRLVHHSIILELNVDSYRLEQSMRDKKEKNG
ncbi:MAG: ATP-binding protein [SAR324 cluster bacterium]|nr:ATP-binding protein [SAR324 cluster bacterium]